MEKIETFSKEYNYIKSDRYKKIAKELVSLLPDYFFKVAASSTGKYHPSFSLGEGGLVRHTKVAIRIAKELLDNNSIGHKFTSDEKDLLIISIMIHDGLKHGREEEKYTKLLKEQIYWLNRNDDKLYGRSKKLYDKYINGTLDPNTAKRCCNFKLLEEKCKEYNK